MPRMMTGNMTSNTMVSVLLRRIWVCIPTYLMFVSAMNDENNGPAEADPPRSEFYLGGFVINGTLLLRHLKHGLFAEFEHLGKDV